LALDLRRPSVEGGTLQPEVFGDGARRFRSGHAYQRVAQGGIDVTYVGGRGIF